MNSGNTHYLCQFFLHLAFWTSQKNDSWLSNSTHPASGRIVCKRGYSLPLVVSVLWLYHHWNSATQLCVDSLHTTCSGLQQSLNKTSPSHYAEKQHSTPQHNPHRRQILSIQHTYIHTYKKQHKIHVHRHKTSIIIGSYKLHGHAHIDISAEHLCSQTSTCQTWL